MVLRQGQKVGDSRKEDITSDEVVKLIVGADLANESRKEIIAGR
jgi:ABC-type sugar transport system ATPase subunit